MHPTLPMFIPPAIALAALIILMRVLRRSLRTREPTAQRASAETGHAPRRWMTGFLAFLAGTAMLLLAVWLLAYLGWTTAYLFHHWTAQYGTPPWFGAPGLFARFILLGAIATCVGGWCGLFFLGIAYGIGRSMIWPDAPPWDDDDPFSPRHYYP